MKNLNMKILIILLVFFVLLIIPNINKINNKIECQCDQGTLNLDICKKPTNEKCFHKNDLPPIPIQPPLNCSTRVNYYNPEITIHDILK